MVQLSQAQTPGQYIAKGIKEHRDGYYQSAIFYFKKALKVDTNIVQANFLTAESYRKLRNYKRSLAFYEATIALDGQDEYPQAHFYAGLMQKQLGKYREAMRSIEVFLSMYRSRDELYRWARDEGISCDWAIEHRGDTADYEILEPDSGINTIHAEMSPFLADSSTLYFSTMRYESDEVKKSKSTFVEIKKLQRDNNV